MHRLRAGLVVLLLCAPLAFAESIDLAGTWRVRLDESEAGVRQSWFRNDFSEAAQPIALPGTLDQAGIGHPLDAQSMSYGVPVLRTQWPSAAEITGADRAGHLVREHLYIGPAWYQRQIEIPETWRGKFVRLHLERVMWQSDVWLDERHLGSCDSLAAPHVYALGMVEPGDHRLTIRIDNDLIHNIGLIGHAYGPETQSRWNGMVGRIELTAHEPAHIDSVRVDPSPDRRSLQVRVSMANAGAEVVNARLWFAVEDTSSERLATQATDPFTVHPGDHEVEISLGLREPGRAWDEFEQPLYKLEVSLEAWTELSATIDRADTTFAFRHIERNGRHIVLNGRRLFLRGTLDCAVYPATGHPPMSVDEWRRVLGVIKRYGFNHVRFHTWCPPEAAFIAADQLGLYLAPETPFWVDDWSTGVGSRPKLLGEDPEVLAYLREETRRISDAYGNHPSFTCFCIGNEFGMSGDWKVVNDLLAEIKSYDDRRLYNASTARRRVEQDDYWVTHTTGAAGTRGVGPAHTDWDFDDAAVSVDLPVIAHETGQRPVYPDYESLLPKFKGTLRPFNLERLRRSFLETFNADRAKEFERASAEFQLVQYKAEHEAMLRTRDYAGYQLLMLNDFTGQSEALVGVLDPYWESKDVVSRSEVTMWNSPAVPLARFDSYVWTIDDTFVAQIDLAHYGPSDLVGIEAAWSLSDDDDRPIARGVLDSCDVPTGGLTRLGEVRVDLGAIDAPTALTLTVQAGPGRNDWPLWVYPTEPDTDSGDIVVTHRFDAATQEALAAGRRVLLLGHGIGNKHAARTGFHSVYWSAGWWGNEFSSLGAICDPAHPALALFPNDGHSDWLWWELTEGATTFLLDQVPRGFQPIVQAVPDFHYNELLGHVFEAKVGAGRLVVCGYDLTTNLEQRHAARQFRAGLLSYMNSDAFEPGVEFDPAFLRQLLHRRESAREVLRESIDAGAAALHVRSAARLQQLNESVAWDSSNDACLTQLPGYHWRIVSGGTWRDSVGCAWHGNPLTIELNAPIGVTGTLFLHVHDWNALGRRGEIDIEDRAYDLGPHAGAGQWLAFEIVADDTRDGDITIRAAPVEGPNLMVTELIFLPLPH